MAMVDPLLMTTVAIETFDGDRALTRATGFFFRRKRQVFLVTAGHVFCDEEANHYPDRVVLDRHVDRGNVAATAPMTAPLHRNGRPLWRAGQDGGGAVDVATLPLDDGDALRNTAHRAFEHHHIARDGADVLVGASLVIAGFPLGFYDTLHHLAVARHAALASSFGLRFQGRGFFLTDARTHRGLSGAPVVTRAARGGGEFPWRLLGVHSSRLDMASRDLAADEALGLNCAWYADILDVLTDTR